MATAKKTEETSLTPAVEKNLALAEMPEGAWGAPTALRSQLIIPRMSIMQGMSEAMKDKKLGARLGEIRESLEGRLLSDGEKPLQFIPFFIQETWVNREKRNGKFEYVGTEPRSAKNDDLPWEYMAKNEKGEDVQMRRDRTINVYALVPTEIDKGEYLPYVLSFSRTSFKAGKKFMTMVEMMRQAGLPPAKRVFELTSEETSNGSDSWYIPAVRKLDGDTNPKHLAAAYKWYQTVSAGAVRVDEPATEETESTGTRDY